MFCVFFGLFVCLSFRHFKPQLADLLHRDVTIYCIKDDWA